MATLTARPRRWWWIATLALAMATPAAATTTPQANTPLFDPSTSRFRHFDTSQGLSQDSLVAIAQDRDGVIWLGTQDGLNRYDGFDTTVFRPRRGAANSLSGTWVTALAVDATGQIWAGTPAGLNRYDEQREGFEQFRHRPDDAGSLGGDVVSALFVSDRGDLWVVHDAGVSRWQAASTRFENFRAVADAGVRALTDAGDGRLWLGGKDGLHLLDPATGQSQRPAITAAITGAVTALLRDRQGRVWIAGESEGLWCLEPPAAGASARLRHWQQVPGDPESLGHDQLRALLQDRHGGLWIGSEAGLDYLPDPDQATARFQHFRHQRHNRHSLGKGAVSAMLEDRDGNLWFGAWEGGANLLSRHYNQMTSLGPDIPATAGLRNTSVRALLATGEGWWLGTEDGVFRYTPQSGGLVGFAATAGHYIFGLAADGETLWLATRSGLRRLDTGTGVLQPPPVSAALQTGRTRRVVRDGRNVWVSLQSQGVYVLDGASGATRHFHPIAGLVTFIAEFDPQTMLVGAQDGLYWFSRDGRHLRFRTPIDSDDGRHDHRGHLPSTPVAFHRAGDGRLWLGSSGSGLLRMTVPDVRQPASARFEIFDSHDGLASDLIGAVLEDAQGRLWVSTTAGISRLDPVSGRFRNFDRHDGTLEHSYWIGAGAKLDNGVMAFGGFDGFTVFDPSAIVARMPPTPQLTAVQLGNRQIRPRAIEPGSPLIQALARTRQLEVPAGEARSLGLRYSAPEYIAPEQLRFRYRLDGFDPDWIESGPQQRLATYTNLAPGAYRFRVQVSNLDQLSSTDEAALNITIAPHWWQTGWATATALLLLASLIWLTLDWRLRRHRRQQLQLQTQVAERTADIVKLGEIGKELTATLDLEQTLERVYRQISARVDTYVFAIALYQPESHSLRDVFVMEAGRRDSGVELSLDEGDRPAVWCLREGRELITRCQADLLDYVHTNLPAKQGEETESIVYLPLRVGQRVIGCLTVQSLQRDAYTREQLEFLRVLCSYTAIALENASSYGRLNVALSELRDAQASLIEREKMASLGGLVAGVAHEVNTPLGIALTAASHLAELSNRLFEDIEHNRLTRSRLREFQAQSEEGLRLILGSLDRAHRLIASFKQVAVDQSSEDRRTFDLRTVCEEILFSLRPSYRRSGHEVTLDCADGITLDSYPGALFQILTNLINNSLLHAFPDERHGHMTIEANADADEVVLRYRDDGIGMPRETSARAFEPFFTTRRGNGGSGLGLHLVYNLTTRLLGGNIELASTPGQGTTLTLRIPRQAPALTPADAASTSMRTHLEQRRRRADDH